MTREEDLYRKRYLFGGLFVASNTLQTVMDRQLKDVGLTSKQWLLMAVLEEFWKDKVPTLKEAASFMGTSHQNVKQIALKLQEKGFLALEKDEKDKRVMRIKRLVSGEDFGEAYQQGAVAFLDTLFGEFSADELDTTLKVLFQLNERLQEMGEGIE